MWGRSVRHGQECPCYHGLAPKVDAASLPHCASPWSRPASDGNIDSGDESPHSTAASPPAGAWANSNTGILPVHTQPQQRCPCARVPPSGGSHPEASAPGHPPGIGVCDNVSSPTAPVARNQCGVLKPTTYVRHRLPDSVARLVSIPQLWVCLRASYKTMLTALAKFRLRQCWPGIGKRYRRSA